MKLKSNEIKEICKIQHKIFITDFLISKMPLGYTNDDVGKLVEDMKIRSINNECKEQMDKLIIKYGEANIIETFSDKEYLQNKENRFTFDEQKQATKEVIGQKLTLEEFIDKYSK